MSGRPGYLNRIAALPLIGLVWGYRLLISPLVMPCSCRFMPSCSAYALEALRRHGAFKGAWLTVRRLARCHPWGGSGYDPVPDTAETHSSCPVHGARPAGSKHAMESR